MGVKVSFVQFDTLATPVDVRISWLQFGTSAAPCDVRVSWLCYDSAAANFIWSIRRTYAVLPESRAYVVAAEI